MLSFQKCCALVCVTIIVALAASETGAAKPAGKIRAGIIGIDTSHAVKFTQLLNNPNAKGELAEMDVVAAYPGGSQDIPESWNNVKGYTAELRGMGVEIVDSIDELLPRVDVVLLESIDGRPHLKQARPVIAAGKPLFVDKPMAASLADAMQIFRLAKEKNVPVFSASSLRFSPDFQAVCNGTAGFGEVRGCTAWSPYPAEPHHPSLFWYGIHGVETLFTIMGPGCKTAARVAPNKVVGVWEDGRQGTFIGKNGYGATVEGTKKSGEAGEYGGYEPLVVEIVKFFKTGKPPVSAEETLEILAFMEAADESQRQGGSPVSLESIMEKARRQID
jgi:predicted dehydrogenase